MRIVAARAADAQMIVHLLQSAGLPTADIGAAALANFLTLRDGDRPAGVVGLELAGDVALLRSLAVADALRGRRFGAELVAAAEALAKRQGVGELYLLTTTAESFFARLGYQRIGREAAPAAIRAMAQFRDLCPASSALMAKPCR